MSEDQAMDTRQAQAERRSLWLTVFLLLVITLPVPVTGWCAAPADETRYAQVWILRIAGAIGPATGDLLVRSLDDAAAASAELFVISLDTPGGLDKAMRDMIQAILASPIPVVTYVSPQGARAASAGTYLLYASHVAAMAPATNLGSATPVGLTSPQLPEPGAAGKSDPDKDVPRQLSTLERKQINDAAAYIRGLAGLRGRNADWAETAVREAANIDAVEALRLKVIDLVATDLDDLLEQLDGRQIRFDGITRTLDLGHYRLRPVEPDWRSRFLTVITDPSIAYVLMLIGIYGLILEFYNPGMGLPGILGGICLLLGLYALQMLPISYVGLGLILLGVALMVTEAFAPGFGPFGIGGALSFALGSILLMDTRLPGYQIAWPLILGVMLFSLLVLSVVLHLALKARRAAVVSGMEAMIGSSAVALEDFEGLGRVSTRGEIWRARSKGHVCKGDRVRILSIDGLTLHVEAQ